MGLGATYAVRLRLIGKLIVDFLLVIIELFFARCFHFVTVHAFDGQTDGQTDGFTIANTALHSMQHGENVLLRNEMQIMKTTVTTVLIVYLLLTGQYCGLVCEFNVLILQYRLMLERL